MSRPTTLRASRSTIVLNKVKTFFSKPHNVILLLLGIVLTFTTVAPIVAIVEDTFKIHAGTIDAHLTGQVRGVHSLRRAVCVFDYAHRPCVEKISELHLYFPVHHAAVDAGRRVAEPV